MLLTLTTRSLGSKISARGRNRLELEAIPQFVHERLGLRGLVVDTEYLKGRSVDQVDSLRIQADQARCPCLVLRESFPVATASDRDTEADRAYDRLTLVARAAHRIGCNALAITPKPIEDDRAFDLSVDFLRRGMARIERMELNLLIEPGNGGLLADPEQFVNLIKKIGGFRVGTMPSFEYASSTGDATAALRQTAPYAGCVIANCSEKPEDITPGVQTLLSVGFEQILALEHTISGRETVEDLDQARQVINECLEQA